MKRKVAFIMAAIMLVTTPASVLASEDMDVSVVSEDIISEDDNAEVYVEETPAEEDYDEEVTDIPEASYETSGEAGAGPEDVVFIEDGSTAEDYATDAVETTEYGDDDFIVSIEEVPTTYSDVSLLDENDDNNKCGENLEWELKDGTLTISGSGEMYDFSSKSDGTAPWYSDASSISSVNIGEGVTSIGSYAFYGCSSLKSIDLSEVVTSIGKYAFYYCSSLTSVSIPKSVESIGKDAFLGCSALEDVYYDGNVEEWVSVSNVDYEDGGDRDALVTATYHFSGESDDIIAGGACGNNAIWKFNENGTLTISGEGYTSGFGEDQDNDWTTEKKKVTAVVVEEGITGIGPNFCTKFRNMKSIDLPDSLTFISDYVFSYCESLTSITIPDGVTKIYEETFYGCSSLETVNIPDNVDYIEGEAFSGCTSLKEIVIPDKVTEIQSCTFKKCTSLTKVTLSKNIEKIGSSAFDGCTSLTDVYFGGSKSDWAAISISSGNDPLTSATIHYTTIDISTCTVTLSSTSYTYNGSAKKPSVTVKNGSTILKSGTDYTVAYKNNTNAGTATVTVTGKGDYTGTVTKNFTINKASQTLSAKASSSSIVKGKTATITASGKGTITYSSNKKSVATVSSKGKITAKAIGTAKITVKAAGNSNYKSASKTLTIKVIPKATTLSSAKSSSSKKLTVKWKKVSGVTGYQIQYSTSKTFKSGNKTATVSGASKVSKTISKLKKGKTYYVRVRTYKKVSGTKYYSSWTSKKKVKVK